MTEGKGKIKNTREIIVGRQIYFANSQEKNEELQSVSHFCFDPSGSPHVLIPLERENEREKFRDPV